jgi:hypothetical protein
MVGADGVGPRQRIGSRELVGAKDTPSCLTGVPTDPTLTMPLTPLQAAPQSRQNPLVSRLGKATRGFVHILGSMSCLGRFGQTSSCPMLKQGTSATGRTGASPWSQSLPVYPPLEGRGGFGQTAAGLGESLPAGRQAAAAAKP